MLVVGGGDFGGGGGDGGFITFTGRGFLKLLNYVFFCCCLVCLICI